MFYEVVFENIFENSGDEKREYVKAENMMEVMYFFHDKVENAKLISIQEKEVIRAIPEGFYVNIPAGYRPAKSPADKKVKVKESLVKTVIEITWLYREIWDRDFIMNISYQELTDLIKDVAEKFEKIHKETDWVEDDYLAEVEKFAKKEIAVYLWGKFGDIPMNPETEEIEISWNGFNPGTNREGIWHWFEQTFDVSVAEDLMHVG